MIGREEIEAKTEEFDVHTSNVQRDYVFGWILAGIYRHNVLGERLVLKGGNCLRKAYFESTRFSGDLDFAVEGAIDAETLQDSLNEVCAFVQSAAGVVFHPARNQVAEKQRVDKDLRVWEARLYFSDFYGHSDTIVISVRMDVTQFERIWLPVQTCRLIHPYSDANACEADIRCVKLEEVLASKLKCLIQRRHVADLYDYAHWLFFGVHDVNSDEVVEVFLRKTIYQRAPRVALDLLVNLPFAALGTIWERFVVCPVRSVLSFDAVKERFLGHLEQMFAAFADAPWRDLAFFPSNLRTPIMEAGASQRLLRMRYHGVERLVEPYSLLYRVRKDGVGREYFYAYDRTGGRGSGPGIKTFVAKDVVDLAVTDQEFDPRFLVEVSKAGEPGERTHFAGRRGLRIAGARLRSRYHGIVYLVECSSCGREFSRFQNSSAIRPHRGRDGSPCFGRSGWLQRTEYR
jgi:predicted nucleotidyltransferase component of viral defense system